MVLVNMTMSLHSMEVHWVVPQRVLALLCRVCTGTPAVLAASAAVDSRLVASCSHAHNHMVRAFTNSAHSKVRNSFPKHTFSKVCYLHRMNSDSNWKSNMRVTPKHTHAFLCDIQGGQPSHHCRGRTCRIFASLHRQLHLNVREHEGNSRVEVVCVIDIKYLYREPGRMFGVQSVQFT